MRYLSLSNVVRVALLKKGTLRGSFFATYGLESGGSYLGKASNELY